MAATSNSTRNSRHLLLGIATLLALAPLTTTQTTCSNYGTVNGTACACPPGLGGGDCTSLVCDNPLFPQSSRTPFSPSLSGSPSGSVGCGAQCSSGFSGPNCNVCGSAAACSAVLGSLQTGTSGSTGTTTLGGSLAGDSQDVTCNTGAWSWTEGFVSCSVVNPTLQGVYPGTTTLTIQKTVDPSLALSPSYATNGTTQAQLWYASSSGNATVTEQFFCKADTCAQTNTTESGVGRVNWECNNLQCTCIPGTQFCAGGGALDLTDTINGLNGILSIDCDASGSGACSFKQSTLQTLFGASGLALSGCTFGECVRPSTIAALASNLTPSAAGSSSDGLSGGVIGGLAVLGAILAAVLVLILLGWLSQRRARAAGLPVLREKDAESVGLRWKEIGYTLPPVRKGFGSFAGRGTAVDDGRVVLNGVSGEVKPSQLLAILGPSGSGKSTLADILAGKRKVGRASGLVELTGHQDVTQESITIGYVDQDDVLPPTSTVREALMFAAELKLGEGVSKEAKQTRVFEVIQQLGLVDVADSIIGSGERRGVSGGERRRVSMGLELVAAPAILICDEVTSGLDSVSALRVIQVLKALTNTASGRSTTVITTIHQPSSQLWAVVDTALVLSKGGRQIFYGPASSVKSHFAAQGLHCPDGWNPADFLLQLASDESTSPNSHATSSDGSSDDGKEAALRPIPSEKPSILKLSKPVTVLFTQFQVLARRELRNLKRDWTLAVMHNVIAVLVGLIVGGLYWRVDTSIAGFQSRVGSLFFLGSLLAFSSLSALSNFSSVKSLFIRERAGAYYSPVTWLISRVVFDLVPLRLLPTILVSCIVYWMVGLSPSAAHFFKYLLILVETNIATTLFNLLLAAAISNYGTAILISSIWNLFQMAFAGFFVNLAAIPAVLRWLQYLSVLKYGLEALAVNEVSGGLMIDDTLQGVKVQVSAALIMDVLFGFKPTAYYRDVLVLFAFIVGFLCLVVVTVFWKLRELR